MINFVLDELLAATKLLLEKNAFANDVSTLFAKACSGDVSSMVELAYKTYDGGGVSLSERWIVAAEEALTINEDLDGRSSLLSAYNLAFGPGDRDEQENRAKFHLETLASSGNRVAQEQLAKNLLYGMNGFEKDESKYKYWIQLANKNKRHK
jgi:hypothetical protein